MAEKSQIQWTDTTWNIARGCTKVDADCKFCYMMRDGDRWGYNGKEVVRTKTVFNLPLKIKETKSKVWDGPILVFTSSLTDVFHEQIDPFRHEMWDIIRRRPDLIFQILTKRPERWKKCMPTDWGEGWNNVWIGTSTGSDTAFFKRYSWLCEIPAKKRFLSIEPLHKRLPLMINKEFVDWVIVGGESGNETGKWGYRPCELEWIELIVRRCQKAEVPVFVKQLGTYLAKRYSLSDRHGGDIDEWPEHLRLRQMPKL